MQHQLGWGVEKCLKVSPREVTPLPCPWPGATQERALPSSPSARTTHPH